MSIARQFCNGGGLEQLPWPFAWQVDVYKSGGSGLNSQLWAAQEVTIPYEGATMTEMAPENRGGFMPWPGVISRESFLSRPLAINFFDLGGADAETMAREWMIELAEKGFRSTGVHDGSLTCILYDKKGGQRRVYNAQGVYPTNVEGFTTSYQSNTFIVKTVTFACQTLHVS